MIKNIYKNPPLSSWQLLHQRPSQQNDAVKKTVQEIMDAVKTTGDEAVYYYNQKLDNNSNKNNWVTDGEIEAALLAVPDALKKAIQQAKENITKFHQAQIKEEAIIETMPGIKCWRKSVAISKVGLYIPSGTAPLFSTVLMLAIPAQLAGCKEIILASPPLSFGEGMGVRLHPAILYTAQLCGITKIIKLGGAVAIAALTYGTATIPKVYKIFGPGNQYVTVAKQLAQQEGIAIDMPAGPSEVCILADDTALPAFVAADLLSQAEHGIDSQVMLVCTPDFDVATLQNELEKQTLLLPRKEMIVQTLQNSKIIIFDKIEVAIDFVNEYAAEHLIICCRNEEVIANQITNAGSIFLGNYSPESAGDYASGTNHTLPTNGYAKQYSGVSVDSFVKKITFQKLTKQGLANIANTITTMAEAEQLQAHNNAVKIRSNAPS